MIESTLTLLTGIHCAHINFTHWNSAARMPHHDGEHTAGPPECFSLKDKCFSKVSTDRAGTHPKYSCKLKFSIYYVLRLLQRINGAYGFTSWTHVVSMGDSERER